MTPHYTAAMNSMRLCVAVMTVSALSFSQLQIPNRSRNAGSNACGHADPVYIQTANETGGVPMFLQPAEAEKSFHLVRESTRNDVSDVLWATGALDGNIQTLQIPVDSVTRRITFTFSVATQGTRMTLIPPSGRTMTQSADIEITELTCGRIVTANVPESGIWRAEIAGSGSYWLQAQAQSDIHIISAEFVRRGGRPGHEGFFRIQGQPLAGSAATLRVSLSAASADTAEVRLISEHGDIIQTPAMRALNSDREFLQLFGSLDLPGTPFRVAVTGRDLRGRQYQRVFAGLFHAENVEVTPMVDFDELAAGTTKQATFKVRNTGAPQHFNVTVTDAHHFVSKVEPSELTIGAGESAIIRVDLNVPAATSPGVADDIIVVVTSTTEPRTSNSSVVHISVPTIR
jgi:von Willebrand factor A domain-containing protein 7